MKSDKQIHLKMSSQLHSKIKGWSEELGMTMTELILTPMYEMLIEEQVEDMLAKRTPDEEIDLGYWRSSFKFKKRNSKSLTDPSNIDQLYALAKELGIEIDVTKLTNKGIN